MSIFDIVGPIMIGPSSSHTAGAARIGLIARKLAGDEIIQADINFHGSFSSTGKGHGTDLALVAGLLGLSVDDARIPKSLTLAKEKGLDIAFGTIDLGEKAHPNSVKLDLYTNKGKKLEIVASSIGGGRIMINQIDGLVTNFSGERPTLIVEHNDTPGKISMIASMLYLNDINIATLQLDRDSRGGLAIAVIELDTEMNEFSINQLRHEAGILKLIYLGLS